MKKIATFMGTLVIFSMLLISCAGSAAPGTTTTPPTLNTSSIKEFSDSSKPIEVSVGQQFEIRLDSNPTTGYTWEKNEVYDKAFLELVKSEYRASQPQMAGSGGGQLYRFKALKAGNTQINMTYKRSWETTDYDKTIIFNVTIK